MADRKSKQRPESKSELSEVGIFIQRYLDKNREIKKNSRYDTSKVTNQAQLARAANMPKARLSRIMHQGENNSVAITKDDILQIGIGLKLTFDEVEELEKIAFGSARYNYVRDIWGKYTNGLDFNLDLIEHGFLPLGNLDL
ncbi:MAG: hypothetical protein LUC48_00755 [Clostridiales bacterium]|nr:hypothetical protein [Clostridiales bacterium]